MSPDEIRSSIMATIASTWATKTLIDWPNQTFTAPSAAPWIRPRIKMGNSYVGELGDAGGIGVRVGVLMISIFVPPGTGIKTSNVYANTLETLFRRAEINGVRFDEPNTDYIGVDEENGFAHTMVSIDFNTWIGES